MSALQEIAIERRRQIEVEGWTPTHDASHDNQELAYAAACYAGPIWNAGDEHLGLPPIGWPWTAEWWKFGDRRRNLVKAGALIVAAIDREDRAAGLPAAVEDDLARSMNAIVVAAHAASSAAGWWIDPETGKHLSELPSFPYVVSTKLMLIVSEIAEAMEGHRKGLPDDKLPHRRMIEVELADAVHRIADLAGALRCDLGGALVEKMAFNAVRPDHKPGARMAAGGKAY